MAAFTTQLTIRTTPTNSDLVAGLGIRGGFNMGLISKTAIIIIISLTLVACGGGGDKKDELPPPTTSPLTADARLDLLHLVQRTEVTCQNEIGSAFTQAVGQVIAGEFVTAQLRMGNCKNGIREIGISAARYWGGVGAIFPWLAQRGPAFGNVLASSAMAAGFPVNPTTIPKFFAAGVGLLNNVGTQDPTAGLLKAQLLQAFIPFLQR